jgi:hypothetical protein
LRNKRFVQFTAFGTLISERVLTADTGQSDFVQ